MSTKRPFGRVEGSTAATPTSTTRTSKLHPLEQALLHELGPRADAIRARRDEVTFWNGHAGAAVVAALRAEDGQSAEKGKGKERSKDLTEEEEEELRDKRARLDELLGGKATLDAIIYSAEESRAVISALSTRTLSSSSGTTARPLQTDGSDTQPDVDGAVSSEAPIVTLASTSTDTSWADSLGTLLEEHDERGLHFLRLRSELEAVKERRAKILEEIQSARQAASTVLTTLREMRSSDAATAKAARPVAQGKAKDPASTLRELRAKREMVRGVLRALILESGMDWAHDPDQLQLMLSLADDDEGDDGEDDDDVEEEASVGRKAEQQKGGTDEGRGTGG